MYLFCLAFMFSQEDKLILDVLGSALINTNSRGSITFTSSVYCVLTMLEKYFPGSGTGMLYPRLICRQS